VAERGTRPRVGRAPGSDDTAPGTVDVDTPVAALAGYPHVRGCLPCLEYVRWRGHDLVGIALVSATLAYHAVDHRHDPLTVASQHFA
jgi:hypothetical protein